MAQNTITPPLELVLQWLMEGQCQYHSTSAEHAIGLAANWGYQQAVEELQPFLQKETDQHSRH